LDERFRSDVDADVLEFIGVEFEREAEVVAGAREDFGADPVVVVGELFFEGVQGLGGAVERGEFVVVEELAEAGEVARGVGEVLFDFGAVGREAGGVREGFGETGAGEIGDRRGAVDQAGVAAEARDGGGAAGGVDLFLEEVEFAAEDEFADVDVGENEAFFEEAGFDRVVGGLEEDFEVLANERVGFDGEAFGKFVANGDGGGAGARVGNRGRGRTVSSS